jgi:predicted nucleic acid-binding protein
MKLKLYIDTSVIGGCFDDEFSEISLKLIDEFKNGNKILSISDLTLNELQEAPTEVKNVLKQIPEDFKEYLSLDEESKVLAEKYIKEKIVSPNYLIDAQHIAIATTNKVDVLVSWNFKHIVNLRRIHLYNSINLKYG